MLSKSHTVAAILVTFCVFIFGCASQPKSIQERVLPGMDKDKVLDMLGNPSRSKRVSGADRWSYDQHIDGNKTTVNIYFTDGKVTYVGSDEEFEKSIKESAAAKAAEKKQDSESVEFKEVE